MTAETVTLIIDAYTISADNAAELLGALEALLRPYRERMAMLEQQDVQVRELERRLTQQLGLATNPPVAMDPQLKAERDAAVLSRDDAMQRLEACREAATRREKYWSRRLRLDIAKRKR